MSREIVERGRAIAAHLQDSISRIGTRGILGISDATIIRMLKEVPGDNVVDGSDWPAEISAETYWLGRALSLYSGAYEALSERATDRPAHVGRGAARRKARRRVEQLRAKVRTRPDFDAWLAIYGDAGRKLMGLEGPA